MKIQIVGIALLVFLAGCATTNSIPYKASTNNVIELQNTLKSSNLKVSLGKFDLANGIDEDMNCRMLGPLKVSPGKSVAIYVKDALQEELFLAQSYDSSSSNVIEARIERLAFSSVSPANWEIAMRISSNKSPGYSVDVKYKFDSSFDAFSACRNVADAFAPAVQELLHQVIYNPKFASLVK